MPVKVLSIAFPFAPVGSHGVGGAEQILSGLDQALVAAGHRSIVIACEGSQTSGRLIAIPCPGTMSETAKSECRAHVQATLRSVICSEAPDLIHMHGLDFHHYRVPDEIPLVVTLHLPISWYPPAAWIRRHPQTQFVCVSGSQRRRCPPELDNAFVIENGVEVPATPLAHSRRDYALVLGRICPEKNAHEALQAGTRAGLPVLLAGQVFSYPEHQRYFHEKIKPLLSDPRNGVLHQFLGPVGPRRRNQLLSEARCLLHPTLAPETSSLVAMESLAAGTPVVAYPCGALPEIVDHGVTGLLVHNSSEMADALQTVRTISPDACRSAAARRFHRDHMIRDYLALYERMVRAARLEVLHA